MLTMNMKVTAHIRSPVQLEIIVVGAGLSGLATAVAAALSGHKVTVFESAKELLEVSPISKFEGPK